MLAGAAAYATVFGGVRGIVHDPQHRPVPGATVLLEGASSGYKLSGTTDTNGEFAFDAVPLGEYTISVSAPDFASVTRRVAVLSGTAPILHFELLIASGRETVLVSADAVSAQAESVTPTTLLDRTRIDQTPGAMRSNSLAMITNYAPGAYMTHDQLHIRGGHQVSWLIDGVPIPNTNIASNIGPQIDPKDIDSVEIQRGSYSADFGDRTYGVFNVSPRTGFERNNEAELVLSAGNFYQTDSQLNAGGHTNRFAYYASASGNRTNLGLETPSAAVTHDAANGYGLFTSLIYNATARDQLRLVAQLRGDYYQVPFDAGASSEGLLRDANRERDGYWAFSWVRTVNSGLVLTASPFYHYNRVRYESDPLDVPSAATQDRSSQYEGGQLTLAWLAGRSNARAGIYGFAQQDSQLFGLTYNDGTLTPPIRDTEDLDGSMIAVYAEEQFKPVSWLTLNAGLRQTHFSGGVTENSTDPRVGASLRVPRLNWVFRAFYGHFYQPPPLATISGPLLQSVTAAQQLQFIPLRGERDEEHQFGVTIPLRGWTLDADNFLTRARNFFDHNNFNNSNLFFPVGLEGARVNGWELTLRSPRIRERAQFYLTYSNQLALGFGCLTGGLVDACDVPPPGYFLLDHDQRNTLHLGGQVLLPWRSHASSDVSYASGFTNGDSGIPGDHLAPHTTFDLMLGKQFGERFSVAVSALNVANRRVLLDNSFTFGGTHYINPREIAVQLRYRFHY